MKISTVQIEKFIGIKEFSWDPSPGFNVLVGPKGSGKSSVLEAIEKAFSNIGRRSELVQHGESEATLFIRTDTNLEIDRRIRSDKAPYLKLREEGKPINSTEKELRQFINGDIFRPLDFINLSIEKQTAIILGMIEINWSVDDITAWFGGEVLGINYDKHILQVLKDIEVKFYKEREELNRQITTLEVQCRLIEKGLPANYDGEEWKSKNLQEYYNKVSEAQKTNGFIEQANSLIEGFENKIAAINSQSETEIGRVAAKYKDLRQDCKDITEISKNKIEKSRDVLNNVDAVCSNGLKSVELDNQKAKSDLEQELGKKIEELKVEYAGYIKTVNEKSNDDIQKLKINIEKIKDAEKDNIAIQETKIATKETEITALDEKETLEKDAVTNATAVKLEAEETRIVGANKYLEENQVIEIEPLQEEADKIAEMREFLREWDKLQFILNGELAEKKLNSLQLTNRIETARTKPSDLLKTHKLPIDGIGIDENGLIRINGTLLDGLSEGEKFEAAFKIALQRMGELKFIALDGFEKLNQSEQLKVREICESNDIQAIVTITKDTESGEFEILGWNNNERKNN